MKTNVRIFSASVCAALALLLAVVPSAAWATTPVPFFKGNSYIDFGTPAALQLADNAPFTVEIWARVDPIARYSFFFTKSNERTTPISYRLGLNNRCTSMSAVGTATRQITIPNTKPIFRGVWHHFAFSFDGTSMNYFLDGASIGKLTYNFTDNAAHTVKIGGSSNATDWQGSLSEVRFWNYARDASEVQDDMNRRLSGNEDGLLGYWPLNEGVGDQIVDGTAHASNGTMINATWVDADDLNLAAFKLAHPVTGSTRFTSTNEVVVAGLSIPSDCDRYQLTLTGEASAIDPSGWVATNIAPNNIVFDRPLSATNITVTAWFTNSHASVSLRRDTASIDYTTVAPVPVVRTALVREQASQPAIVIGDDLDNGSTGGGLVNGQELGIYDRVAQAVNPDHDSTPDAPYVTLPGTNGTYQLTLTVINEAGTVATGEAVATVTVSDYVGTHVWTGKGLTDLWSDGGNWNAGVPVAGQTVSIASGSSLRLTSATPQLGHFEIAEGATLTFEGWESTLHADEIVVAGTITHTPQSVTSPNPDTGKWKPEHRIFLEGSNLTVTSTGKLDADYKGYGPEAGPGSPRLSGGGMYDGGGGGGYGGHGGDGFHGAPAGLAYGDFDDPSQPGSGGCVQPNGRPAGGAIRIDMQGEVMIGGLVTACGQNGAHSNGSSGSGGGITIICNTFQGAGSGLIRADGGRANMGGGNGGGGRIALRYNPVEQAKLEHPRPPVRFSTYAWLQSINLGANIHRQSYAVKAQMGTLYLPDLTLLAETPTAPAVLDDQRFWYTRLYIGSDFTYWAPESLVVSDCVIGFPEGFTLEVAEDLTLVSTLSPLVGEAWEGAGLTMYAAATNELYGARLTVGRDLTIGQNSWLYPYTEGTNAAIVGVRAGRHVTVAATGGIDADEKGFMPKSGNGNGRGAGPNHASGGAYGGAGGGALVAQPYGEAALPLEPGSPGGWAIYGNTTVSGSGGGAIHVLAGGNLTIDGLLTANGGAGWYYRGPGGSGGSIFLAGRRVSGSGTLHANGGEGAEKRAPGGGGRIAIWRHIPLDGVEKRIADRDLSGLVRSAGVLSFEGELHVDAIPSSSLAYDAELGTSGFYTIANTVLIVR